MSIKRYGKRIFLLEPHKHWNLSTLSSEWYSLQWYILDIWVLVQNIWIYNHTHIHSHTHTETYTQKHTHTERDTASLQGKAHRISPQGKAHNIRAQGKAHRIALWCLLNDRRTTYIWMNLGSMRFQLITHGQ